MNETNSTESRKNELEKLVREARKDKLRGYAKAVGGVVAPLTVLGGLSLWSHYAFENSDLATLVSLGAGFVLGMTFGEDYLESMREVFTDIRYASSRIRNYSRELTTVE